MKEKGIDEGFLIDTACIYLCSKDGFLSYEFLWLNSFLEFYSRSECDMMWCGVVRKYRLKLSNFESNLIWKIPPTFGLITILRITHLEVIMLYKLKMKIEA